MLRIILLSLLCLICGATIMIAGSSDVSHYRKLHNAELEKGKSKQLSACLYIAHAEHWGERSRICHDIHGPNLMLLDTWAEGLQNARALQQSGGILAFFPPPILFAVFFVLRGIQIVQQNRGSPVAHPAD